MAIENANSHPIKVVKVEEGGPYANSHPYKVEVVKGGSSTELVSELPEVGEEGTTYVLVDSTTNPSKVYGMYIYLNEWILTAQPVDQAVQKVEELPQEGQEGILYYLEKEGQDDTYDLYRWINSEWIKVDTDIKLYDSEGSNTDGAATQRLATSLKGLARTLTTADYNWPTTGTKTSVAAWLLEDGVYITNDVPVKFYATEVANNTGFLFTVATNSSTGNKQVLSYGNNWLNVREIEPTLGSTLQLTNLATASLVYAYPNTQGGVRIGYNAQAGDATATALGWLASTAQSVKGAIALGAGAFADTQGQFDISTGGQTNWGYNGSQYRLLTGLYDPQSAHDAATKGYIDTLVGDIETALHTLNNGEES